MILVYIYLISICVHGSPLTGLGPVNKVASSNVCVDPPDHTCVVPHAALGPPVAMYIQVQTVFVPAYENKAAVNYFYLFI